MKQLEAKLLLVIFASFIAFNVEAHLGGLNADGCHTNKSTGEYHCHTHNTKASSIEAIPISQEKLPTASEPTAVAATSQILRLNYDGFTVWLDCAERAAIKFRYNASRDTGNLKRYDKFALDPNVPASWVV